MGTKNFTVCMETQNIPNSQSNLEKEKQRNQAPWPDYYKATGIKTVLYWHTIWYCICTIQYKYHTDQYEIQVNGTGQINPCIMVISSMTKEERTYNREKTIFSISGTGKAGQLYVKQNRTLPNTIHKNKVKMD
ncbi:unnamed protein product [Rangifer tarandus platyrhynchus]|uniref:Uncharacterized protein n=2 Tax=Rangifer tarandus platyrhynchus TaxID=3082113 RepID=A0ABN8ZYH6_RANTA|nr:unnamed protein product [Rangifer tarandus platyrhynchus]